MVFRHNVDMTLLEEGLLVAWCWEAAGMEGDKALGSPECPLGNSKAVSCRLFAIKRTESAEDRAGSHTPEALQFFREQGAASPRGLAWRTPRVGPCPVLFVWHRAGRFLCPQAGSCVPTVGCRKEQDTQHQAGSSAQPAPGQGQSLPGQVNPARAL